MPTPRLRFQLNTIKDGDTLIGSLIGPSKDQSSGQIEAIRLYGIDCPELAQHPYGKLARQRIQALLAPYRSFEVVSVDRDTHDRLVAELWVADGCINTQLLAEGYAVAYVRHLKEPYRQRYLAAEAVARKARLNFWSQTELEPPWEYRRRNPRRVG